MTEWAVTSQSVSQSTSQAHTGDAVRGRGNMRARRYFS